MSALIFGTLSLGGSWDNSPLTSLTVDRARDALRAAVRAGITEVDTADIYCHGKSEKVLGTLFGEEPALRGSLFLQSKVGIRLPGNTAPWQEVPHYRLDREYLRPAVEASLERLGTDYLDRLLVHRPDPLTPVREVARALDELVEDGLVRQLGLSNMSWQQVAHYMGHLQHPVAVLQVQASLQHRGFVESQVGDPRQASVAAAFPEGTVEFCHTHGVELQAWGALDRGRYTGVPVDPAWPEEEQERVRRTSALVLDLARQHYSTPEAVVLAWLMKHPAGFRPVLGSTDPERIRACVEADLLVSRLSHEDWYRIWTTARGSEGP